MKKVFILWLFVLSSTISNSQHLKLDTMMYNGSNCINLVFTGDGYRESELDIYKKNVKSVVTDIFKETPFKQYKSFFNVFSIQIVSKESGIKCCLGTHPCTDCEDPDNFFGSVMDGGTHVEINSDLVKEVVKSKVHGWDNIIVLVNSTYHFGTAHIDDRLSVNPGNSVRKPAYIVLHELGHSIGDLGDEYNTGNLSYHQRQIRHGYINLSTTKNPKKINWKHWLDETGWDLGIGIYHHTSESWIPHENCRMKKSDELYCAVCTEQLIVKMYEYLYKKGEAYTSSICFPTNKATVIVEQPSIFRVKPFIPEPNTLKYSWYLDGVLLSENPDSIILSNDNYSGIKKLRVTITDATSMVRSADNINKTQKVIEWDIYFEEKNIQPDCASEDAYKYNPVPLEYEPVIFPHYDTIVHHFVFFDFDKYKLKKSEKKNLLSIIAAIDTSYRINGDNKLKGYIIGKTCTAGDSAYNKILSVKRAKEINRTIKKQVRLSEQTIMIGLGESSSYSELSMNRNVELILYNDTTVVNFWLNMPETWKKYFSNRYQISSDIPGPEQLKNILSTSCITDIPDPLKKEIYSLYPVMFLKDLKKLDVSYSNIKDLELLKYCRELEYINCNNCSELYDIQGISELKSLKTIDISYTKVQTLSSLYMIASLESVTCIGLGLTDIQPLYNKKDLRYLDCSDNKITDLCPLYENLQIETLNISKNEIVSITPLVKCNSLNKLNCSRNKIVSINALKNLPLETLDVSENNILYFSDSGFTKLKHLNIAGNPLLINTPLVSKN